jgi:REP element-mobilizing transposase RayT
MAQPIVIAHHLVWTVYGSWLPNDPRGSGSDELRNPILVGLGELHKGRKAVQPNGRRIREFYDEAKPLLQHPISTMDETQRQLVGESLGEVVRREAYTCWACAVMPDHVHILMRKHKHEAEQMAENLMTASRYRLIDSGHREKTHPTWIARLRMEGLSVSPRRDQANHSLHRIESAEGPTARADVAICETVRQLAVAPGAQPELALCEGAPFSRSLSLIANPQAGEE